MPAAPTIRPYYDPAYDAGTPAIVSFWAAFLGERSEMNKAEMKRRVALMDPSSRRKEAQALRNNIADLERTKVQAVAKGQEWLASYVRAVGTVSVADTQANTAINLKKLEIRGESDKQARDQEQSKRDALIPKKQEAYDALDAGFEAAEAAKATGRASSADNYMSGVREAISQEGVGEGDPKAKSLAYTAIAHAKNAGDQLAVNALRGKFFPGEDPDEWMKGQTTTLDPALWEERMQQVTGGLGAGGGTSRFLNAMAAVGLNPDGAQGGGGTVGVERGTATRGSGLPGMGGLGQPIDTSSTDAIIDMYKKQLEALTNPSSSGNQFAGYRSNYLLETPFKTSAPALEETLRAMNEMSPTERSLLMDSLRQTGGRAEPAAQYRRDNFTGPQNGPLVAIADTGGDAYDWLQKSLDAALSKIESGNEAMAEKGRGDLQQIASEWGNLPPEMRAAFPQLEDAIVSGNTDSVRYIQRFFEKRALDGGGPDVGQWLADQATVVSQIRDPEERAYRASKLYEIAQNVPREMGGDVAGTIVRVYEESSRAGNINLLDGGFKAIGTETQKTRDRQSRDFTRDVSENAGELRSSETEARLSVLSRQSREADGRLREMNPDNLERDMTREEDAEYRRNAAELERIIVDSGIERDFLLNPSDPRAASRWADVQRQRGDSAEALATEVATKDPREGLRGSIDMPSGPGAMKAGKPEPKSAAKPIRDDKDRLVDPDFAPVEPQAKDDLGLTQIDMDQYLMRNGQPGFSFAGPVAPMVSEAPPAKPTRAGSALPYIPETSAVAEQARNTKMTAPSGNRPGTNVEDALGSRQGAMATSPAAGPSVSSIAALVAKQYVNPDPKQIASLRAVADQSRKELLVYGNKTDKSVAGRRYAMSISELYLSGVQVDDPTGASLAMAQYARDLDGASETEQDEVERIKHAAKAELVRRAAKEVLGQSNATGPTELPFAPRVEPTTDDWAP